MLRLSILAIGALVGVFYQVSIKPRLELVGVGRILRPHGNTECSTVNELQACEDIALHQATGNLYLACSTPASRVQWTPALGKFNTTGRSTSDYVALYDPLQSNFVRLQLVGFESPRGLNLHGMDVVPSTLDPNDLWVYLVNHRPPLEGDVEKIGADSCVEVFKTTVGSNILSHVKTVENPLILTPNDIVGAADGSGFWLTNDHGSKIGRTRMLEDFGFIHNSSVAYCSVADPKGGEPCKLAAQSLPGANGIAFDRLKDIVYVACHGTAEVRVFRMEADNTLAAIDAIKFEMPIDNLSIDHDGHVWAAGLIKALKMFLNLATDPTVKIPSAALRVKPSTHISSSHGRRYEVDQPFEDDGFLASASTSVAYDVERKRLFMSGVSAPALTVCHLDV